MGRIGLVFAHFRLRRTPTRQARGLRRGTRTGPMRKQWPSGAMRARQGKEAFGETPNAATGTPLRQRFAGQAVAVPMFVRQTSGHFST